MGNKYVTILLLSYSLNRYRNKCYVLNEWNTLIFSLQFWLVFFYTHLLGPLGQDVACLFMIQTWQVLMSRWILMETTCNHILYVCLNLYDKAFSWWHLFGARICVSVKSFLKRKDLWSFSIKAVNVFFFNIESLMIILDSS